MDISVRTTIPYPRVQVFETMRDRLPALVEYLPNVGSITVERREEHGPDDVTLHNRWVAARTEIPAVARPFIDASKLTWLDRARWRGAPWTCQWDIEVAIFPERVRCAGVTTFVERGGATEVHIQGKLELSLKGLVPGLLAGRVGPTIEGFVVKLIQPNFQKTAEAVRSYLDSRKRAL